MNYYAFMSGFPVGLGMGKLITHLAGKHSLFAASFAIRLVLVVYGDYQDRTMEVKYTDIDYHVFSDAARLITEVSWPGLPTEVTSAR